MLIFQYFLLYRYEIFFNEIIILYLLYPILYPLLMFINMKLLIYKTNNIICKILLKSIILLSLIIWIQTIFMIFHLIRFELMQM